MSADGRRRRRRPAGALTVVDAATGKGLLAVQPPEGVVIAGTPSAALSADGSVLAYGGRGKNGKGEVVVWSVDKNELLARFETAQAAPGVRHAVRRRQNARHPRPAAAPPKAPAGEPRGRRPAAAGPVRPDAQGPGVGRAHRPGTVPGPGDRHGREGRRGRVLPGRRPARRLRRRRAGGLWEVRAGQRLQTLLGRKGQGVWVAFAPDGEDLASVAPTTTSSAGRRGPPLGTPSRRRECSSPGDRAGVRRQPAGGDLADGGAVRGRLEAPTTDCSPRSRTTPRRSERRLPAGQARPLHVRQGRPGDPLEPADRPVETMRLMPARLPNEPLIQPGSCCPADATRATWPRTPAEVFDVATRADVFCSRRRRPRRRRPPRRLRRRAEGGHAVRPGGPAAGAVRVWDLAARRRAAELELPSPSVSRPPH